MALIDVVEWNNSEGDIIYRFPEGDISLGAQLIVRENQQAILFKEGQALDTFGPGRHTLTTGNIPLLEKLINLPFGGKTPFPAEVYFINITEIPDMKWGTKTPIQLQDPVYQIPIPVRAFGAYSLRIRDVKPFLIMATGTWQATDTDSIGGSMRDQVIIPRVKDLIAEFMIKQKITILQMVAYQDEIAAAGKAKMVEEFESFGLELLRFSVESINYPEDDEMVQRLKKALADNMEINVQGANYDKRRTYDTVEKAASNEGMAGAAMGAGMGFGMGNTMGQNMNNMMAANTNMNNQGGAPAAEDPMAKLEKLKKMADAELITQEEYEAKKKDILAGM
jgi:membrane protease subunit (stomatin/prohibitin family)